MYKIARIFLAISILLIVSVSFGAETLLQTESLQEELMPTGKLMSLNDCVKYGIYNSFEVRLAKLDLYIAQTDLMYSEAIYDTFLYGGIGYEEDKREQLSVFAPNDSQTNTYSIGLSKTLPTGTEVNAEFSNVRYWDNSVFVTQNPAQT